MKLLKPFGQFWYDFIIGDDWKIAVAVVTSLLIVGALMAGNVFGDHGLAIAGGITIVIAFAISLAIDVRPKRH